MSSNIVLNGTTYNGIAKVYLPQEGEGDAVFVNANETKDGTLLCTLSEDATLKTILTDYHIPVGDATDCLVMLKHCGTNAPTTGSYTVNWVMFCIVGGELIGAIRNSNTGLSAPDSIRMVTTATAEASSYYTFSNGEISASQTTNDQRYFAAGNSMYYLVIPFTYGGHMTLRSFS